MMMPVNDSSEDTIDDLDDVHDLDDGDDGNPIDIEDSRIRPGDDGTAHVVWWRRLDKVVVIACFFLAIGVAFVARGLLVSVTGDDRSPLPANIEQVNPVPEAVQALSQTQVFVDLADNFTGVISIDGIEIDTVSIRDVATDNPQPGQQTSLPPVTIFEPGNATLTFVPSSGAPIESFSQGVHTVVLRYWNVEDGENTARTYTWTFNVV
jgi:hypothetical protein